jgi:hypothetical protein
MLESESSEDIDVELSSRERATRNLVTRAFTMLMTTASDGVRMSGREAVPLDDLLSLLANILVDSIGNAVGAEMTLLTIAAVRAEQAGDLARLKELADKLEAGGFTHSAAAARKILGS